MNDMDYKSVASLLLSRNNFLILTHKNPDGDAVGSACALCSALRRIGKTAYLYANPDMTAKYLRYAEEFLSPEGYMPEYTVAVDIASVNQFPKGFSGNVELCIDHHPTNSRYASKYLVMDKKASCGEIILRIIKNMCGDLTRQEATLLYIAVSTDTGCFRYSNTNAATFKAASELMEAGADNSSVNESFFRKVSRARLKLEGMIYSDLRFYRDGEICMAMITSRMIEESGAVEEDFDDLAALAGRAEGAKLCVTVRELPTGESRISLRSSPGVDCSTIAAVFGGGGHKLASGCTINGRPERAKEILLEVIDEVWS